MSLGTVLGQEGATQAGDDAVVVAQPADRRCRGEGAGEGIGVEVEGAPIGRRRTARTRGRRRRWSGVVGGGGGRGQGDRGENDTERSCESHGRQSRRSTRTGGRRPFGYLGTPAHARVCSRRAGASNGRCTGSRGRPRRRERSGRDVRPIRLLCGRIIRSETHTVLRDVEPSLRRVCQSPSTVRITRVHQFLLSDSVVGNDDRPPVAVCRATGGSTALDVVAEGRGLSHGSTTGSLHRSRRRRKQPPRDAWQGRCRRRPGRCPRWLARCSCPGRDRRRVACVGQQGSVECSKATPSAAVNGRFWGFGASSST